MEREKKRDYPVLTPFFLPETNRTEMTGRGILVFVNGRKTMYKRLNG